MTATTPGNNSSGALELSGVCKRSGTGEQSSPEPRAALQRDEAGIPLPDYGSLVTMTSDAAELESQAP
jgi:hypothetical protein